MKPFFFITGMLCAASLQAQETVTDMPRLQERLQDFISRNSDTTFRKGFQNLVVVLGNSVVTLPQDSMPCIVPDTKGIAVMPNAITNYQQPVAGQIPNAWKGKALLQNSSISK